MSSRSPSEENSHDAEIVDAEYVLDEETQDSDPSTTQTSAVVNTETSSAVPGRVSLRGDHLVERKQELIKSHEERSGRTNIYNLLKQKEINVDKGMDIIIEEMIAEAADLKGNALLFQSEGQLKESTAVEIKRIEALETIAKTLQRKVQMQGDETIDLDSPYIALIVKWIISKIGETFTELEYDPQSKTIFFSKFDTLTSNWKREVKNEIQSFAQRQAQQQTDLGEDDA